MENKNISQIVLERIKEEGIKPISRNIFSIKRVLFWVAIIITLIVGAFTFSLVLLSLFNNDWDLYNKFGFNFIFRTLPYFWIISLVLFVILGEHYYRKTLLGHRRSFLVIIELYMTITMIFGLVLYLFGVSSFIEQSLEDQSSVYSNIIFNRHEFWSHPENGLLSGQIIQINDEDIQIIDFGGFIWVVNIDSIPNGIKLEVGQRIKIIGDITDESIFNADEIRPWMGMWARMR